MGLSSIVARVRSLWRGLRHRNDIEADMAEEFKHHLDLRTEDLIREGMTSKEASRRARIEFGHLDNHKRDARASRGLKLFDEIRFSSLDVKIALRMLMKYPGLSLVSVIGMSVAIAIGTGAFAFTSAFLDPGLPLDEGERIVSLQNADAKNPGNPNRQSLHDFLEWRDELTSITELSAFTTSSRNLVIPGGGVQLVRVAEMTASGFRVARVSPVLGRALVDEDEHAASPPVAVIAYEEWQRKFAGDSAIVGRQVRLGALVHTVVGVMPEGYRFPVNHRYWIPLRLHAADHIRGGGPSLVMFGRLLHGATIGGAQAELTTIGLRTAARFPETHEHLRPRVLRYTHDYVDVDSPAMAWALRAVQLAISLLLVVVAVDVAILVYARTATRAGEIAVRTALGASRKRVVAQLAVEALVLSVTAAAIGLMLSSTALRLVKEFQEVEMADQLPFWLDLGLSPGQVGYAVGLALLAALIVGVLPALKATGAQIHAGLQRLPSRGSSMHLGKTWTALIVVQVAVAMAALPFAVYVTGNAVRRGMAEPGYPADKILRGSLSMEREESPPDGEADGYHLAADMRFREKAAELVNRLESEPAVAGVTFATTFPGIGRFRRFQVEGVNAETDNTSGFIDEPAAVGWAVTNRIDTDLLNVFDVSLLAGRGFVNGDGEGSHVVLVNRVLADRVGGGRSVLGRRFRFVDRTMSDGVVKTENGPWLEIIGVLPDFTVQNDFDPPDPKAYLPMELATAPGILTLAVRVREGSAPAFAGRLREITTTVDPTLQLHELRSASNFRRQAQRALLGMALVIAGVTGSVLLLSAAGIYAMMSFTVARRRREIGIRAALGANPRRILTGIFARASAQLGAGLLTGLVLAFVLDRAAGGGPLSDNGGLALLVAAVVMTIIGLVAALGPARRGLAVQPTEALREE